MVDLAVARHVVAEVILHHQNFAIALNRLSSSEHVPHRGIDLGGNPHRIRQRHWPAPSGAQHDISVGTVLARSKREGWTQQIATAKLIQRPELARELAKPNAINAISPMQSVVATLQQRGQRYAERVAAVPSA